MKKHTVRNLFFPLVFPFLASLIILTAPTASAGIGRGRFVEGELLIQAKAGVARGKIDNLLGMHGAATEGEIAAIKVRRVRVPAHALEKVKAALSKNPNISFVEENFIAEASFIPNDQYFSTQWHLPKISAPEGWDLATGSTDTPIAIIDSGVDPDHPDLTGKLIPGYNFLTESTDTHDVRGHGTAVAGSAAAQTDNATGVAGVAGDSPIMPLVVLNADNWATYYDMARAITYAADQGVPVMNISLAGSSSSSALQNAVNYAWDRGAVIVAAAANYSTDLPYYPAACNHVVAVSATTSSDTLAGFSNYGSWVDLSAPGASIRTTSNGGGYGYWNGTSFASPITAGLAALIFSANPQLTNAQVVDIMTGNADDLGEAGFDSTFANGRINVYESLLEAVSSTPAPDTTPPAAAITVPSPGAVVGGEVTVHVSATDDVAVSQVDLYIDGAFFSTDSTEPYSFLWDSAGYADGLHGLAAVAIDSSGNTGQSDPLMVTVDNQQAGADTVAPTVTITSPGDGSSTKRNVNVQVAASDDRAVTKVEFYLDGEIAHIVIAAQATYSWRWNTSGAASGDHVIAVRAYDTAANMGTDTVTLNKPVSASKGGGKKK
ncbi:S8 family serine peptidase [Candidatus Moduliflexota bacterium]